MLIKKEQLKFGKPDLKRSWDQARTLGNAYWTLCMIKVSIVSKSLLQLPHQVWNEGYLMTKSWGYTLFWPPLCQTCQKQKTCYRGREVLKPWVPVKSFWQREISLPTILQPKKKPFRNYILDASNYGQSFACNEKLQNFSLYHAYPVSHSLSHGGVIKVLYIYEIFE